MQYISKEDVIRGFKGDEFRVHIQPKYNLYSGQVIGGEALVRWEHKKKGILCPDLFIPIVEELGLIEELDFYVFDKVCKSLFLWKEQGLKIVPIAINISCMTLKNNKSINKINNLVKKYNLDIELIEIEITETLMCTNIEHIKQLKKEGFKIAMDDFGTGYSSLSMLKHLPVDIVKIDREFLVDIEECENTKAIFKTITTLLQVLKKEIIVEGVETNQQLEFIKSIGCKYAQGFLLHKPIILKDFGYKIM